MAWIAHDSCNHETGISQEMNKNSSFERIRRVKNSKFFVFFTIFNFYYGLLFVSVPQIRSYESSAWRMITDRLLANSMFGKGSFGNLLVIFPEQSKKLSDASSNSLAVVNGKNMFEFAPRHIDPPEIYTSQFGLLGDLGRIVQSFLHVNELTIYISFSVISVLISSLILARFCCVMSILLGNKAGIGAMATFLTPWPVLFAANFYYSIFGNLVFLLIPGIISDLTRPGRCRKRFETYLMISVMIFTFIFSLTNYTYITVWVACLILGLIFVSSDVRITAKTYVQAFLSLIIGFSFALILHLIRVQNYAESIKQSSWIEYIFRNKVGIAASSVPQQYKNSISKSPLEVLDLYLRESLITPWIQNKLPVLGNFINGYVILLCITSIILIWLRKYGLNSRATKLFSLNLIAISGPIGWILLMRPHSWDNIQVNYIFTFLPFYPLAVASLLSLNERRPIKLDKLELKRTTKVNILVLLGLILLSFSIYFLF
jgi:hypothetical protein